MDFHDAIKIVPTKQTAREENLDRLKRLNSPIFHVTAQDSPKFSQYYEDQCGYLEKNLFICEGAEVVVNHNVSTERGIYNAARGRVHKLLFSDE